MGACCSCFCCPICTACGTACSVPCATCCDYGGLAWLERDSTLALSLASLLLGLCLHLVMTVQCAALHDTSWSPLPTHYENGPCFGSGGDNAYANHGLFGAVFMGVGFPFTACCLYARATKARHREQRRMLGLAEPVTYWWGFTHSFRRVYYTMPMAPVVPGGLAMGGAGSALYPHAPFGGASPPSPRRPDEVPLAAVWSIQRPRWTTGRPRRRSSRWTRAACPGRLAPTRFPTRSTLPRPTKSFNDEEF